MQHLRKTLLNPDTVTTPMKPYYANGVVVSTGPLMFISGQVSTDLDGKTVAPGDLRGQTVQVLENIKSVLAANGGTMHDILKVTVYVTDMRAYDEVTDIRNAYFGACPPASTIVQVVRLADPDWMIEIDAVASAQ